MTSPAPRPVIAVDLGGTRIKAGIVRGVECLASGAIPAHAAAGLAARLPDLEALLRSLCAQAGVAPRDCAGLGMALPFLVDPVAGRVLSPPPEKYGDACSVDLAAWARSSFGLPLKIENDAHAACLGEWRHGAGRGSDDLVMLTLGTGIGCSVILRGRPLRGKHFQAGVLGGHLIADPGGPVCGVCPSRGCYESLASTRALPGLARSTPGFSRSTLASEAEIDSAAVFRHAGAGDDVAVRVRDRCVEFWGALCVSLIHAFDPDRIVIGGAIAGSAGIFLPVLQGHVDNHAWTTAPVRLFAAELGNAAAFAGLSSLFAHPVDFL